MVPADPFSENISAALNSCTWRINLRSHEPGHMNSFSSLDVVAFISQLSLLKKMHKGKRGEALDKSQHALVITVGKMLAEYSAKTGLDSGSGNFSIWIIQ